MYARVPDRDGGPFGPWHFFSSPWSTETMSLMQGGLHIKKLGVLGLPVIPVLGKSTGGAIQVHSQKHGKFKVSLGYINPVSDNQTTKENLT